MESILRVIAGLSAFLGGIATAMAAGPEGAPGSFAVAGGERAVFVDFIDAHYDLTINVSSRSAASRDVIRFRQAEAGRPLFDLVAQPSSATIDGRPVAVETVRAPDGATSYRLVAQALSPGEHLLEVLHPVSSNLRFEGNDAMLGFFMSDLDDRQFLENYLVSNLEYDAYAMELELKVEAAANEHELFVNGEKKALGRNHWKVVFPPYFSTSSPYLHVGPKAGYSVSQASHASIDGRALPVTVYSRVDNQWASQFMPDTLKYLAELERDYGPFPHERVVVYGVGIGYGGMEHCGATITSIVALGHELAHSYFARGVMPVDGNSGWMDEAIASWRDSGYKRLASPGFGEAGIASHSPYARTTDRRAYRQGRDFLAHVDELLADRGGLKPFLKELVGARRHDRVRTEELVDFLEDGSGIALRPLFERHILGRDADPALRRNRTSEAATENPFHPRLAPEQKRDLL